MRNKVNTKIPEKLLTRYLAGRSSPAEEQLIGEWYASFEAEAPYFENENSEAAIDLKTGTKATIQSIIAREMKCILRVRKMIVYSSAAAAALVFLTVGLYWMFLQSSAGINKDMVKNVPAPVDTAIIPGANKAILTLADGKVIDLDKAGNGTIAKEGSIVVNKREDGRLEYQGTDNSPAYNILSTPKGGQYQIVLPDGTKVWLNAASSIKYPTVFMGNERNVEITGEAYFEVEKHAGMPFTVKMKNGAVVKVLGTHFNVNAYDDEESIKTTLLEGSVKITKDAASAILRPGEQVSIFQSSQLSQPIPVQTDEVMAWKNGLFQFNNVTIETVMKQVARWYDVQVVYVHDVSQDLFRGKIYRNAAINELLRVLELSGAHFTIEGKKIIVQ
ncbi:hypothetical protein A4H97_08620 [Niastella yeongjuensis]|uniref:Iron dicitrate transport regulator FecR n=1 Tax=Niastella yeongjuensis TaxID=354355 RepID=A0A1V9EEP8_9BACT|nr:FecR domain-containing protein [Niastella yeongjuensis]OQP44434.1 hypothetical protein A4H97_08620 [Niastella yeongjuensis]SEO87832.1 FecR family protein [Niastella yeongjuensis]